MLTKICLCPYKQGLLCVYIGGGAILNAWQIGFTCLRDLAFDNIESQLNEKNIINELFSPFTAEQVSYLVTSCIPEY